MAKQEVFGVKITPLFLEFREGVKFIHKSGLSKNRYLYIHCIIKPVDFILGNLYLWLSVVSEYQWANMRKKDQETQADPFNLKWVSWARKITPYFLKTGNSFLDQNTPLSSRNSGRALSRPIPTSGGAGRRTRNRIFHKAVLTRSETMHCYI